MHLKLLFKNRNINKKLRRWDHHEGLDPDEPKGCGYPICVDVDMRPKRFKSMCSFVKWLRDNNHVRRIFLVQKGGCEDVSKFVDTYSDPDWHQQKSGIQGFQNDPVPKGF